MKAFLTFALWCCSCWCFSQSTALNLASDIWPPFTNEKPHRSFASELVEEALKRSGVSSQTKILEFEEVIEGIKENRYDGSAALWYDEEREQYLLFSAPYLQNQMVVVGRKGANVGVSSFAELAGKKVAVVGSYAYGSEVNQANEVILVEGSSDQENLERLLKEEVDYMLVDGLLMEYLLTHQSEEVAQYLEIGKAPLFKRSLHFAINRSLTQAASIIDRFNKTIIKMMVDGTYNKILELNWIRADIDGDGKLEMIGGSHAGKAQPTSSYDVWFQSSPPVADGNQYYVDGKLYPTWDSVPQKYKVAPPSERPEDLKLLKFSF